MLSAMRRNSRHAIIYVLFGILIAAFVISFGPGSRGFGYSGPSSAFAAKVAGSSVSEQDFHFAYVALGGTQYPPQVAREQRLKEFVMVKLIIEIEQRELMADKVREALRVSAKVSPDEVKQEFEAKGLQVNLEYGKFPERRYEEEVGEATPAEVDAYVKAHEAELKKQFE